MRSDVKSHSSLEPRVARETAAALFFVEEGSVGVWDSLADSACFGSRSHRRFESCCADTAFFQSSRYWASVANNGKAPPLQGDPCGFKSRHVHQIRWLGGLGFLSLRGLQTLSSPVLKRVTFSRPHDVKAAVGGTTKGREARANLFVLPYGNI